METALHIISAYWILLSTGLLFIALGIAVPKYQWYWLIAGLNGLSTEELKKYDLRAIEKFFGKMMITIGVLTFLTIISWVVLERELYIFPSFAGIVLLGVVVFVTKGPRVKSKAGN